MWELIPTLFFPVFAARGQSVVNVLGGFVQVCVVTGDGDGVGDFVHTGLGGVEV
jgi:hypothetical protein